MRSTNPNIATAPIPSASHAKPSEEPEARVVAAGARCVRGRFLVQCLAAEHPGAVLGAGHARGHGPLVVERGTSDRALAPDISAWYSAFDMPAGLEGVASSGSGEGREQADRQCGDDGCGCEDPGHLCSPSSLLT